jgi:hypothetical protein
MIKVLLPQICPELQNITTVNMTITSGWVCTALIISNLMSSYFHGSWVK